jgi:pantothenate kinase
VVTTDEYDLLRFVDRLKKKKKNLKACLYSRSDKTCISNKVFSEYIWNEFQSF